MFRTRPPPPWVARRGRLARDLRGWPEQRGPERARRRAAMAIPIRDCKLIQRLRAKAPTRPLAIVSSSSSSASLWGSAASGRHIAFPFSSRRRRRPVVTLSGGRADNGSCRPSRGTDGRTFGVARPVGGEARKVAPSRPQVHLAPGARKLAGGQRFQLRPRPEHERRVEFGGRQAGRTCRSAERCTQAPNEVGRRLKIAAARRSGEFEFEFAAPQFGSPTCLN